MNAPVQYRRQGVDERRGSRGRSRETSGRLGGGGVRRSRKPAPRTATTVRKTHPLSSYDAARSGPVSENSEVSR